MLTIQDRGIFKLVQGDTLESWTSMGWRLVAAMEQRTVMPFYDSEALPPPAPQPNMGQYYPPGITTTLSHTRHHEVITPVFLIVLDEEEARAGLQAELATLREQLSKSNETENLAVANLAAARKLAADNQHLADERAAKLQTLTDAHCKVLEELRISKESHETYVHGVIEHIKAADERLELANQMVAERRKTAYERVAEGAYDDGAESLEERDER